MKHVITVVMIAALSVALSSCARKGCTDENATNYDSKATKDDGSCIEPEAKPAHLTVHFHPMAGMQGYCTYSYIFINNIHS